MILEGEPEVIDVPRIIGDDDLFRQSDSLCLGRGGLVGESLGFADYEMTVESRDELARVRELQH